MGKDKNPRRVADNEAMAKLRMLAHQLPRSSTSLAAMIRGKKVEKALNGPDLLEEAHRRKTSRSAFESRRLPMPRTTTTSTSTSSIVAEAYRGQEPGDEAGPPAGAVAATARMQASRSPNSPSRCVRSRSKPNGS